MTPALTHGRLRDRAFTVPQLAKNRVILPQSTAKERPWEQNLHYSPRSKKKAAAVSSKPSSTSRPGESIGTGVEGSTGVGVEVGVFVGVLVGVLVGVRVGVFVAMLVGVFVGVFVEVGVGVLVGCKHPNSGLQEAPAAQHCARSKLGPEWQQVVPAAQQIAFEVPPQQVVPAAQQVVLLSPTQQAVPAWQQTLKFSPLLQQVDPVSQQRLPVPEALQQVVAAGQHVATESLQQACVQQMSSPVPQHETDPVGQHVPVTGGQRTVAQAGSPNV